MHRSLPTGALAAVVLVLGLSGCGGGSGGGTSEADIKEKLADQLSQDGELDKDTAECFAGVIVDEIGVDKLKDVDFSADEPPAGLEEEFTAAAMTALDTCDIDPSTLGK